MFFALNLKLKEIELSAVDNSPFWITGKIRKDLASSPHFSASSSKSGWMALTANYAQGGKKHMGADANWAIGAAQEAASTFVRRFINDHTRT